MSGRAEQRITWMAWPDYVRTGRWCVRCSAAQRALRERPKRPIVATPALPSFKRLSDPEWQLIAAMAEEKRPGHCPNNSVGYHLKVDVVARNADEARTAALEYMQRAEPSSIHFQIDVRQQAGTRSAPRTSVFVRGEPLWFYQNTCGPPATEHAGVATDAVKS